MRIFISLLALLSLSGCTTIELAAEFAKKVNRDDPTTSEKSNENNTPGVVAQPRYKIGDPYEVKGVWYYPERDLAYDETGIASWYGDEFAGKLTANGEIFDPTLVSAAHKTLPMPSAVRVINLDNGRSLVVRINDRGPFIAGRIIDLSREAARLLGFQQKGIAKVRVQILTEESLRLERAAKDNRFPSIADRSAEESGPSYTAAAVPSVSLTAKDGSVNRNAGATISAVDLISSSRSTGVIELPPVATSIWVQVGAFSQEANARVVAGRLEGLGPVSISSIDSEGRVLHRVRLGPISDVNDADEVLAAVFGRGFSGAKIILE